MDVDTSLSRPGLTPTSPRHGKDGADSSILIVLLPIWPDLNVRRTFTPRTAK